MNYIDPGSLRPPRMSGQPGYPDASPSPLGTPDPKYAGGPGGQPLPMYALGGASAPQTNMGMGPGGLNDVSSGPGIWTNYMKSLSPSDRDSRLAMLRQYNPGMSDAFLSTLDTGDYGGPGRPYANPLARKPTQFDLEAKARSDAEHSHSNFWNDAAIPLATSALAAYASGGTSIAGQGGLLTAPTGGRSGADANSAPGSTGGVLGGTLGLIGAGSQQNAYQNQADWARNVGQPYRDTLQGTYTNPMGYLGSPEVTGAVQQGTDALSRSLSMGGNPVGSGGALQQLQNYSTNQQLDRLAQYRQQLGGFGGLNAINQSIPGTANTAIGARGNTWNAGGSLLTDIFGRGGVGGNIFGNVTGGGSSLPTNPAGGGQVDFGNDPSLAYGYPSQFDPGIDWSSLYG